MSTAPPPASSPWKTWWRRSSARSTTSTSRSAIFSEEPDGSYVVSGSFDLGRLAIPAGFPPAGGHRIDHRRRADHRVAGTRARGGRRSRARRHPDQSAGRQQSARGSGPGRESRCQRMKKPKHRAGFVAILGRPNAGKSTLLNALLGTKLAIVAPRPQTTRTAIQGVLKLPGAQIVFVDTPGIHESSTLLNKRMMDQVRASADADVVLFLVDATARVQRRGRGGRRPGEENRSSGHRGVQQDRQAAREGEAAGADRAIPGDARFRGVHPDFRAQGRRRGPAAERRSSRACPRVRRCIPKIT